MEIGINTQFPYDILFWFSFFQHISQINYEDNNLNDPVIRKLSYLFPIFPFYLSPSIKIPLIPYINYSNSNNNKNYINKNNFPNFKNNFSD